MSNSATGPTGKLSSPVLVAAVAATVVIATVVLLSRDGEQPGPMAAVATAPAAAPRSTASGSPVRSTRPPEVGRAVPAPPGPPYARPG